MTSKGIYVGYRVYNCSRCGQDHISPIQFKLFSRPIVDSDGIVWDRWGMCPVSNDVILSRPTDEGVEFGKDSE